MVEELLHGQGVAHRDGAVAAGPGHALRPRPRLLAAVLLQRGHYHLDTQGSSEAQTVSQ